MAPISSRPKTMKAVVLKRAGVVAAEEVPIPRLQADTDVLIKVHVAGLCGESEAPNASSARLVLC
jgi:hypothetical protein